MSDFNRISGGYKLVFDFDQIGIKYWTQAFGQ